VLARRIGAAIGIVIVMALRKVTEGQAFTILRRANETTNRKFCVVADDVLLTATSIQGKTHGSSYTLAIMPAAAVAKMSQDISPAPDGPTRLMTYRVGPPSNLGNLPPTSSATSANDA
jgi:hypothetical protein